MTTILRIIAAARSICEPCQWGRHYACTRLHCDCCGDYTNRTGAAA